MFPRMDENVIDSGVDFSSKSSEGETENFSKLLNNAQCRLLLEYKDISIKTYLH